MRVQFGQHVSSTVMKETGKLFSRLPERVARRIAKLSGVVLMLRAGDPSVPLLGTKAVGLRMGIIWTGRGEVIYEGV